MKKIYFLSFYISLFLLVNSCRKSEVQAPSYIQIDQMEVFTDYSSQGSSSSRITDAWVTVDGKNLGAYELPCKFPVLSEGKKEVIIYPGIKFNGLSSARKIYTFYGSYTIDTDLVATQTCRINPKITYASFVKFVWMEDFENAGVTIVEENNSNSPFSTETLTPKVLEGNRCGKFSTSSSFPYFEARSSEMFALPTTGANITLELNYSCTTNFYLGIVGYGIGGYFESYPVYTFNASSSSSDSPVWRKIYLNLSEPVGTFNTKANKFKIYFQAGTGSGDAPGEVLLDNVKLLYY